MGHGGPGSCPTEVRGTGLEAYLWLEPETEDSDDVRRIACARYAWAIPSDQALDVIARYGRIVEVGAGFRPGRR